MAKKTNENKIDAGCGDLQKYKDYLPEFPTEASLPFKLSIIGLSYDLFCRLITMVSQGVPVDIAFKAEGLHMELWTFKTCLKVAPYSDESKCIIYLQKFHYFCLANITANLYRHACSDKPSAVNAARLFIEFQERLECMPHPKMIG